MALLVQEQKQRQQPRQEPQRPSVHQLQGFDQAAPVAPAFEKSLVKGDAQELASKAFAFLLEDYQAPLLLPQALALACLSLAFAPAAASQGAQGWPQGQAHLLPPCVGLAAPAVPAVPAVPAAALAARVHAQARRSRWLLALLKVMLKLSLQDRLLERQSCRPPHALQDWGWQAKPLWGCSHTSAGAGLGG